MVGMIIDCISDLHGFQPKLDGGDLLIVAGDITARDVLSQWCEFFEWFAKQQYRKKILIAGNHDGYLKHQGIRLPSKARQLVGMGADDFDYLCDYETKFEGLKIWGSPWTPTFYNWYFMRDRGEDIKKQWDLIPNDIDILITHGPCYGILDKVVMSSRGDKDKHAGCVDLRNAVERIQPKMHVCGHIHSGYGQISLKCTPRDVLCVNCSIMDDKYDPVNKPIRIEL